MGSSSKKRQTMAKMTRERLVKEKRALKQEKKDRKKQAAAAGGQIDAESSPFSPYAGDEPHAADDAGVPEARSTVDS